MRGPTTLMNGMRSGDYHSKERCSQKTIASANDIPTNDVQRNYRPYERCPTELSPLRTMSNGTIAPTNDVQRNYRPYERCPTELSPLRTTPNELSLVLRKLADSVITFQRKKGVLGAKSKPFRHSATPEFSVL
jgi:hypothetical protein